MPTVAATLAVVVGAVAALFLATGGGQAQEAGTATGTDVPPPVRVFDGGPVKPWIGFVSSQENWQGTEFSSTGASQGPISATVAGDGLRVAWNGTAAQVYLQSPASVEDLSSYMDTGALVFDVAVHKPPANTTIVAVHCVYPCGAKVPITTLLQRMTPEEKTTVKLPLRCFAAGGLDPRRINTPFLVYTDQPLDATFSNVRWEVGAATDKDATPCADLH